MDANNKPAKKPNFMIVVADDLGFSDTSPYGSEIHTPNLQKLSDEGIRMTDFHTAASCSPTRSMLLSGTDAHIAGLGCMAERMKKYPHIFEDKPGYEGYLNFRVAALPEIMQDNGYHTIMSGKWHLGITKEVSPWARGFTKVITTLPGAGNHFNHEPQLYDIPEDKQPKGVGLLKGDGLWMREDKFIRGAKDLPEDFYSSNFFTDEMINYLRTRTDEEREKPFFGYLAFTAPHWPLQAPKEVIGKYKGWYDSGPTAHRDRRVQRLVELGLVPKDVDPAPLHTMRETPWDEMTDEQRQHSCRAMEIYAAMVDLIDVNMGKLRAYLEEIDELDNTFIVFISDNGAEGQLLEAAPILAGFTMGEIIAKYYDNSLDNLGAYNSFTWYGPQWASAATAPSRACKSYTTEGGIRCPCIVRYPPLVQQPGGISHTFTTVMDILPTVLDLAGVQHPGDVFRGRPVAGLRGHSWVPLLGSQSLAVQVYDPERDVVGWEQLGNAGCRVGDWKLVMLPPPRGSGEWELYDLSKDQAEMNNLAKCNPEILHKMVGHYETYYAETGMFDAYTMFYDELKKEGVKRWW
ncbi:MAG: hypothetical protein STHCBS139747_004325 [Sporothrix thermara]